MADDQNASPCISFDEFREEVLYRQRYIRSRLCEAFLSRIKRSVEGRTEVISSGETFWRAQIGHDWEALSEAGNRRRMPLQNERMKPWIDRAYEGRVNPKGISCLYLATSEYVAMSEIRPWIGTTLSLARFRTVRPLRIVDCSLFHALTETAPQCGSPNSDEQLWRDIDRAFAQPVLRSDNTADYAPTQLIAEFFRLEGFDGIFYGSAFSEAGRNIALFDIHAADQLDAVLFEVTGAKFDFTPV
ncbi:MAG: RES domain-containing protein [Alphaproteobacteria bacterium HGW-Alphaproteobacteria-18]|nr:MAG: RES domain-containing protein [Alphaproteobacteria bacterium HGW-Alphaproteobacteria-18]